MKLKLLVGVFAAMVLGGCSRFYIKKENYSQVKKAALVQYALNPRLFLGTTQSDEARQQSAEANGKTFIEKMNGMHYTFLTIDELKGNPAYQSMGKDKLDGYYTTPGMRFLAEDRANDRAELTPEQAKELCEKLGVDAVVAVAESWSLQPYAMGFRAKANSVLTLNMYDKSGERIWGDVAAAESDEGMAYTGGVVSTDVPTVVLNAKQSFANGVEEMKKKATAVQ
ncbi:MAG: hypothetical protein ACT4TC_22570 [Myxococcaceae bacterium]